MNEEETIFYKQLGRNLFFWRTHLRWTQTELATKLDVTANTVSRWEKGTYKMSIEALVVFARLLEIKVSDVIPSAAIYRINCKQCKGHGYTIETKPYMEGYLIDEEA